MTEPELDQPESEPVEADPVEGEAESEPAPSTVTRASLAAVWTSLADAILQFCEQTQAYTLADGSTPVWQTEFSDNAKIAYVRAGKPWLSEWQSLVECRVDVDAREPSRYRLCWFTAYSKLRNAEQVAAYATVGEHMTVLTGWLEQATCGQEVQ
jgi:hypothetical protein